MKTIYFLFAFIISNQIFSQEIKQQKNFALLQQVKSFPPILPENRSLREPNIKDEPMLESKSIISLPSAHSPQIIKTRHSRKLTNSSIL